MYRRAAHPTAGQSTVEFALLLPIVALMLGGLFEIAMLLSDDARVQYAAREAARTAAVDPDPERIEAAARRSGLSRLEIEVSPEPQLRVQGEPVRVSIEYRPTGRLPFLSLVMSPLSLTAATEMRIERP